MAIEHKVEIKRATRQQQQDDEICLHCTHFKEVADWHTRTGLAYICELNDLRVSLTNVCEKHERSH